MPIYYQFINGEKQIWKYEDKEIDSVTGKRKILCRTKRFNTLEEAQETGEEVLIGNPHT